MLAAPVGGDLFPILHSHSPCVGGYNWLVIENSKFYRKATLQPVPSIVALSLHAPAKDWTLHSTFTFSPVLPCGPSRCLGSYEGYPCYVGLPISDKALQLPQKLLDSNQPSFCCTVLSLPSLPLLLSLLPKSSVFVNYFLRNF